MSLVNTEGLNAAALQASAEIKKTLEALPIEDARAALQHVLSTVDGISLAVKDADELIVEGHAALANFNALIEMAKGVVGSGSLTITFGKGGNGPGQ